MKIKLILLSIMVGVVLLGGCAAKTSTTSSEPGGTAESIAATGTAASTEPESATETEGATETAPDAVSAATNLVATDDATLIKALGTTGSLIISFKTNLTTQSDLVIEGVMAPRIIALYNQDAKRVKTATYTLTAPRLTVKSEMVTIKGGIFKGDVYVQAKGFTIVDGKVEGNVYFATKALKDAFVMGTGGSITGVQEIKP